MLGAAHAGNLYIVGELIKMGANEYDKAFLIACKNKQILVADLLVDKVKFNRKMVNILHGDNLLQFMDDILIKKIISKNENNNKLIRNIFYSVCKMKKFDVIQSIIECRLLPQKIIEEVFCKNILWFTPSIIQFLISYVSQECIKEKKYLQYIWCDDQFESLKFMLNAGYINLGDIKCGFAKSTFHYDGDRLFAKFKKYMNFIK